MHPTDPMQLGLPFSEAERQTLIAHLELAEPFETPNNTHYPFHPRSLEAAAAYFLNLREDWTAAYPALQDRGLLQREPGGQFSLTPSGLQAARRERLDHPPIWYWYREYFARTAHSAAYSRFCRRLYGRDLTQTNFSDMPQIEFLVQSAGLQPGMRALDLGCGNGRFAEYLSDSSAASVWGVDYVPEAVAQALERTCAKRSRLNFYLANLDHLEGLPGPFDLLTSIDTLYMPNDLPATLAQMNELLTPGGKMLLFYSQMLFGPPQPRSCLLPGGTGLGLALAAAGLSFTTTDFSEAAFHLLRRKRRLAEAMRAEFEAEGSRFLLDHLLAESDAGDGPWDPAAAASTRYLYCVQKEPLK